MEFVIDYWEKKNKHESKQLDKIQLVMYYGCILLGDIAYIGKLKNTRISPIILVYRNIRF